MDGVFDELRDRRDSGLLQRADVRLLAPVGPYDRDFDGMMVGVSQPTN